MVIENHRAKLEAEQSLVSDIRSPLSVLEPDEGHLKGVSTAGDHAPDDGATAAMLTRDVKERGEADYGEARDPAVSESHDQVILLTFSDLEVISEGELLDVSGSGVNVSRSEVSDFQLEVDWQRKQLKPELEIAACALP